MLPEVYWGRFLHSQNLIRSGWSTSHDIAPLTFDEFLEAIEPNLFIYYNSIQKDQHVEEIFHNRLLETYNNYLIIGGMPECVSSG